MDWRRARSKGISVRVLIVWVGGSEERLGGWMWRERKA
jgi:hypothetical protein